MSFPGTEPYDKALLEGLIQSKEDERKLIYEKVLITPEGSYANLLFYLAGFSYFPLGLVRFLAWPPLVGFLKRDRLRALSLGKLFSLFVKMGDALIVFSKGLRAILRGDFRRIRNYLARYGYA